MVRIRGVEAIQLSASAGPERLLATLAPLGARSAYVHCQCLGRDCDTVLSECARSVEALPGVASPPFWGRYLAAVDASALAFLLASAGAVRLAIAIADLTELRATRVTSARSRSGAAAAAAIGIPEQPPR